MHKFDSVLSKVMYCGGHHFYGAFCFLQETRLEKSSPFYNCFDFYFTTVLIFTLQVFKRVLYSNGNEKQRGITMHQDVEKILVTEEELNAIAHRLAKQITKDYEGKKLLLVGVLKGSIYFFTTLQDILIYRVILILFKLQVMVQVLYQAQYSNY